MIAFTALEWIPYMESPYSQSGLPLTPSYRSNCGHKVAVFALYLLQNYSSKQPITFIKLTFRNV